MRYSRSLRGRVRDTGLRVSGPAPSGSRRTFNGAFTLVRRWFLRRLVRSAQSYQSTGKNPFKSWAKILDCGDVPLVWLDNNVALKQLDKAHLVRNCDGLDVVPRMGDNAVSRLYCSPSYYRARRQCPHLQEDRQGLMTRLRVTVVLLVTIGSLGTECNQCRDFADTEDRDLGRRPYYHALGTPFDVPPVGSRVGHSL